MILQMLEKEFAGPSYKMRKAVSLNTGFLYTASNIYINLHNTEYNQQWSVLQRAAVLFTVLIPFVMVPELDSNICCV